MLVEQERRNRRSDDLALALQYLLASQRTRAGLTHLLLASVDGFVLAYDGEREDCEELAAYAPFIARGEGYVIDPRRLFNLTVHTFTVGKETLYLMLRGSGEQDRNATALMASIEGIIRILGS